MVSTKGVSNIFLRSLIMNKAVIYGAVVVVLGLLISLGPQFLFKVCGITMTADGVVADCCAEPSEASCCGASMDSYPICYWTAQAEMGVGLLIAALGACMIVFTDAKTHLGLLIGVFMASLIAFALPNFLIPGCATSTMQCREVAFPALTIESILLFVFSVAMIVIYAMQKPSESGNAA
jgi:hypothetical protein